MIVLLYTPGHKEVVQDDFSNEEFLKKAQKHVTGYIAPVNLYQDDEGIVTMYVDDEGLLKENKVAIVNFTGRQKFYMGPAVFSRVNREGASVDLTKKDIDKIKSIQITNIVATQDECHMVFRRGEFDDCSN